MKDVQVIKTDTLYIIDSLELENQKTVILSEVKEGTIITIKNSNPAFSTVDVDGLFIPEKKHWYNSRLFKGLIFLSGLGLGVYITK